MFRKIAIALVAASVLSAPVLAQGSQVSPTTPAPTASTPEKSEKAVTKVTKHRVVARHHRHGSKMAKYTKSHGTKMVKHHGTKMVKYAKGARASAKSISSKRGTKPSSSKPAAKSSLD
jgi:hypothetical protein